MTAQSSHPEDAASKRMPPDASLDGLIHWLENRRATDPLVPLSNLLDHESISENLLIELAASDLIRQRRQGHDVVAEDYLKQFPRLGGSETHILDLVDAEICVRREMKDSRDADFFVDRFPRFAATIGQLVHLDVQPDASHSANLMIERELTIADVIAPASVPTAEHRSDDSIDVPIPIRPPNWMTAVRCVATSLTSSGRCWLVKGRDTQRNDTVAMKIVPLQDGLDRNQRMRILDICELTSSVTHPVWVAPRIAAIDHARLAVVRPWVFGQTLSLGTTADECRQRLAMLVNVAFALSAAHRIGATHGGVHAANVVIDHQSKIHLIDATSGKAVWEHHLSIWDNDLTRTRDARISRDTKGLLRLIAAQCIESPTGEMKTWVHRISDGIEPNRHDACARIGESLQSLLDKPPAKPAWWQR